MTNKSIFIGVLLAAGLGVLASMAIAAQGNATRGRQVFRACAACHSLQSGRQMTGPSLADLWNRKAGSLSEFHRYSAALKSSDVVWNEQTLDAWIADPQHLIPGNQMTFPGIKNPQQRTDLLAFLKDATQARADRKDDGAKPDAQMGNMMGMMGGGRELDLKTVDSKAQVRSIRYCRDTYKVTMGDGATRDFWERNLRFKTDGSESGPTKGAPVILPAGMMGDRASVIFAAPEEISGFIAEGC